MADSVATEGADETVTAYVRDISSDVLQTLRDAMRKQGISTKSDAAATKWGATQYALHLRAEAEAEKAGAH